MKPIPTRCVSPDPIASSSVPSLSRGLLAHPPRPHTINATQRTQRVDAPHTPILLSPTGWRAGAHWLAGAGWLAVARTHSAPARSLWRSLAHTPRSRPLTLRSNYDQLGLSFQLHSAEILFNCGLAKIYLG